MRADWLNRGFCMGFSETVTVVAAVGFALDTCMLGLSRLQLHLSQGIFPKPMYW